MAVYQTTLISAVTVIIMTYLWHWLKKLITHLQHYGDQGRESVARQCHDIKEPILVGIERVDKGLISEYFAQRQINVEAGELLQFYYKLLAKQGLSSSNSSPEQIVYQPRSQQVTFEEQSVSGATPIPSNPVARNLAPDLGFTAQQPTTTQPNHQLPNTFHTPSPAVPPSISTLPDLPQQAHNRRLLSADELKNLQKAAKDMDIPRLGKDSSFALFSAWRASVTDWLLGSGICGQELHPDSVKYLAHRLLQPTFHEDLRRQGVWVDPTWDFMISKVREGLGFNNQQLRAKLRECKQEQGESTKAFLARFCWIKEEGCVGDNEAKDILLNGITQQTRLYLERKLEPIVEDDMDTDNLMAADKIELIPFYTIKKLLSRGPLLEAYPAKPAKVNLESSYNTTPSQRQVTSALAGLTKATQNAAATPNSPMTSAIETISNTSPARVVAATQAPLDLIPTWNAYLTIAAVTMPDALVHDPASTLASLACILQSAAEQQVAAGHKEAAEKLESVAADTVDRFQAAVSFHPRLIVAPAELVPRRRETSAQRLFDVARGFSRRVPMSRLLEIEHEIRPYLASLVVRAVQKAGDRLVIPDSVRVDKLDDAEFEQYQLGLAAKTYNHYGALQQMVSSEDQQAVDPMAMLARRQEDTTRLQSTVRDLTSAVRAMQEQMQGYFEDGRALKIRRMDVEDDDSTMGQTGSITFLPEQSALIAKIETQVARAEGPGPCRIAGVHMATHPLSWYKDLTHLVHPGRKGSKQAHIVAAILGGKCEAQGVIMMDTGAALSIVTEKFCEVHGIKIEPVKGTYYTASFGEEQLLGVANFDMQVNNQLVIRYRQLAVQPGNEYQAIIGGDGMWDDNNAIGDIRVTPGVSVEFCVPDWDDVTYKVSTIALKGQPTIASAATENLPPPPPPVPNYPPPPASPPPQPMPVLPTVNQGMLLPTMATLDCPLLTTEQRAQLEDLLKQRQQQLDSGKKGDEWEMLQHKIKLWLVETHLPKALRNGLGQCLWRRTPYPIDALFAVAFESFKRGEEIMWAELKRYGVTNDFPFKGKQNGSNQGAATSPHSPPLHQIPYGQPKYNPYLATRRQSPARGGNAASRNTPRH